MRKKNVLFENAPSLLILIVFPRVAGYTSLFYFRANGQFVPINTFHNPVLINSLYFNTWMCTLLSQVVLLSHFKLF